MSQWSTDFGLPTSDQVSGWKRERDRLVELMATLEGNVAALNRMISAAETLGTNYLALTPVTPPRTKQPANSSPINLTNASAPRPAEMGHLDRGPAKEHIPSGTLPAVGRRTNADSWTETLFRIISENQDGISFDEMRDAVMRTHLGPKLEQNDKSFYGALDKLRSYGKVLKYKDYHFVPEGFAKFLDRVNAGVVPDKVPMPSSRAHASPIKDAIIKFLTEIGNVGASTATIIEELETNPSGDAELNEGKKGKVAVYNLISRMTGRGELIRKDGKYFLAPTGHRLELGQQEQEGEGSIATQDA